MSLGSSTYAEIALKYKNNSVMQPHQSCGLPCQLNHPFTREKWTVDKPHQFQSVGRMNPNIMTCPSRTALSKEMDQLRLRDKSTFWWLVINCCCLRHWNIVTGVKCKFIAYRCPFQYCQILVKARLIRRQSLVKRVNGSFVVSPKQVLWRMHGST